MALLIEGQRRRTLLAMPSHGRISRLVCELMQDNFSRLGIVATGTLMIAMAVLLEAADYRELPCSLHGCHTSDTYPQGHTSLAHVVIWRTTCRDRSRQFYPIVATCRYMRCEEWRTVCHDMLPLVV